MADPHSDLTWLKRLQELSRALAQAPDPGALIDRIVDSAIELARAERGFLVLVERSARGRPSLDVAAARGFDAETLAKPEGKVSRTVVERAFREERTVLTTDDADRDLKTLSTITSRHVRSLLCVPLRRRGEVIGVLYLDHRFDADALTATAAPIVEAFADQAALALEARRLATAASELEDARRRLEDLRRPGEPQLAKGGLVLPLAGAGAEDAARAGDSQAAAALERGVAAAAAAADPVLISGEAGAGKEHAARRIHQASAAADGPFRVVRCAATDSAAVEAELFGADDDPGELGRAAGGALFLDEVGALGPDAQRRLLDALVAGVSTRLIASSRVDLGAEVRAGRFDADLYYRLSVLSVAVPPLRERKEDLPALLSELLRREGVARLELTPRAKELLFQHSWPGNVRELENEARRLAAAVAAEQLRFTARDLSPEIQESRGISGLGGRTLKEVERRAVEAALEETGGNKAQAARKLGVPKSTLYDLLDRHGLR